jgi:hypothetical protein
MGWGEFSDSTEIVAAEVPDKPNAPVTVITNIFIRIEWDEPYLNSSPILAYKVYVADADGIFNVENYYCNGSVDPCLSQRYCEIPMSVLIGYNMEWNHLVQAKVSAKNQYGWSEISDANTDGARIQETPA